MIENKILFFMNWTNDVEQALTNSLTCSLLMYDKNQDHVNELMLVMVILKKLPTAYDEYETVTNPTVPIFYDAYIT